MKLNVNQHTLAGSLEQWRSNEAANTHLINARLGSVQEDGVKRLQALERLSAGHGDPRARTGRGGAEAAARLLPLAVRDRRLDQGKLAEAREAEGVRPQPSRPFFDIAESSGDSFWSASSVG